MCRLHFVLINSIRFNLSRIWIMSLKGCTVYAWHREMRWEVCGFWKVQDWRCAFLEYASDSESSDPSQAHCYLREKGFSRCMHSTERCTDKFVGSERCNAEWVLSKSIHLNHSVHLRHDSVSGFKVHAWHRECVWVVKGPHPDKTSFY